MSLSEKTFKGVYWSFFEALIGNGVNFLVLLYLARIIGPTDFGIISICTIFISISLIFVDGGMSISLLRQKNCTYTEYSTLFYFNLLISIIFFNILFFSSNYISSFFEEIMLSPILKSLSLLLIINAFSTVQRTYLIKKFDFKSLYKSSAIASILSGIISVYLVLIGYGIWSVVAFQLLRAIIFSLLVWYYAKLIPIYSFSFKSLKNMWNYGYKLLLSGLINTGYENLYLVIIGKIYSTKELGLYDRANQIQLLIAQQLDNVISKVSFPVIAEVQNEKERMKSIYSRLISHTMFISVFLMMFVSSISESLILIILGSEWIISATYLKLLCFVGLMYPIHSLNLNLLKVKGSSSLFLFLEIIKKIVSLPVLLVAWKYGILYLIYSIIIINIISIFINCLWSGKFVDLGAFKQINLFWKVFCISMFSYIIVNFSLNNIFLNPILEIFIATFIWMVISIPLLMITKNQEYIFFKNKIFNLKQLFND